MLETTKGIVVSVLWKNMPSETDMSRYSPGRCCKQTRLQAEWCTLCPDLFIAEQSQKLLLAHSVFLATAAWKHPCANEVSDLG